ncbi:MAG TPA: penicillin-binding protein 2 [Candidatus Angelobacter sp.]|nr:penicillin-binding protein 2 [Candidatus Angelobacter sp.]
MAPWTVNDSKIPQERLAVVSYLSVAFVVLLLVGFWKLQVVQSGHFADLAERNRVRSIPIIAPRGAMLDREGRVLVDSYPSFSILLLRDDLKAIEKDLPQIVDGLGISKQDLQQQLDAARNEPKFQPVIIKPAASLADIAFVESHRADLPVLELMMVQRRRYPHGAMLGSATGYVGEVSAQQLEQSDGRYRPGDIVGKAGLERQYNETLEGTDGMRRVVVNSIGKVMRTLDNVEAIPGKPIQLTIDYDLQAVAENAMVDKEGAIVAMDARTGEVLAMVSRPTVDPNDFAVRIGNDEWQKLNSDPETPLMNRAIQAQLAPGSVFKIVMATAMLESKAIPETMTAFCPGYAVFYGRTFKCHVFGKTAGHGVVDLHRAIVQSCDIFFYNVGKQLGIDRISSYATSLGLGRRTGIDLPSEEPGLIPSEEWAERVYHRKWYAGETISVAVGQGAVTTTPLQLARMIAAVASGGTLVQPHLLKSFPNPRIDHFNISDDTVEKITQGMYGVVNEGGTAAGAKLQNIEFCGKSGSAQVIGYDVRNRLGKQKDFKDNAWFVGYAPRRNPEIVVAVLVQSGEHGGAVAGPIARDIVKLYYDKKNARSQQQATTQSPAVQPDAARQLAATVGAP